MKKIFLTLAVVMMTLTAFAKDVTKNIDIPNNCKRISVGSYYRVELQQSNKASMTVVVDEELEPYIVAKVNTNGTIVLRLDSEKMPWRLRNNSGNRTLKAVVALKNLESVELSGASQMDCSGTFSADDFNCDISGATHLRGLKINGKYASYDISGASSAEVDGKFDKIDCEIGGAAHADFHHSATTMDVEVSGASQCKLNGEFNTLSFDCSGASASYLGGKASFAEFDCSGASKIYAMELIIKRAEVDASGASHIDANVLDGITVELSGASHLNYSAPKGVNPEVREMGRGCSMNRK